MAAKLTTDERIRIVDLLREGKSIGVVAKEAGRSKDTVARVGREAGIVSDVRKTKKANEARAAYSEARRLEIIGKGFGKADELLRKITDPGDLQKWTVAVGVLVDKARLETGEVTDRSEHHSHSHTRDLEAYFADLDAYRAEHGEADAREPVDTSLTNGQAT